MNDPDDIPATPPVQPPAVRFDDIPPPRHGCLTALMVLAGVIFLLPGLCTIIFATASGGRLSDPLFGLIAIITFAVGFGGIVLIRLALRGRRS
jgi:hypothetical protein